MKHFFSQIYGRKILVLLLALILLLVFLASLFLGNNKMTLAMGMLVIFHAFLYTVKLLHENREKVKRNFEQQEALSSILNIIQLEAPLPPTRGWAASPDYLKLLLDEILSKKPQTVLECGSGVSTLIIGYALKKIGTGKLISLDHEKSYHAKSVELVKLHKLEEYVDVRLAPLVKGEKFHWYNIDPNSIQNEIDFISVDGPPVRKQELMRYPVLPVFKEKLGKLTTLLLDDAYRSGEQSTLRKWVENFDANFTMVDTEKGAAIMNIRS